MIRYFKVYGYLEILITKKNAFQIISNIFSGIDVFKVDLVKNSKSTRTTNDFKILNSLNKDRIGYTKVCSYENISDCIKIIDLTSLEKNSLIINVELDSANISFITQKLIQNKSKISFLIVKKNSKDIKKLTSHFKLLVEKKNFVILINNKIYNKDSKIFFENITKSENVMKMIYSLYININRFR